MKKFSALVIGLSFVIIGILYITDWTYSYIYANGSPRNKLQYVIQTKGQHYNVAFFGSSRVANHIDTEFFQTLSKKRAINLGVEGAGLNDNLLLLKLFIEENTVDEIYLQIDSNFENISPSNISISEAMPFIDNPIVAEHCKRYLDNYNRLKYIPFYRYAVNDPKIGFREVFMTSIHKKPKTDPSIGFTPRKGTGVMHVFNLPKTISNQNCILNEIVTICKQNNIALYLYTAPFCNKLKSNGYLKKMKIKIPELIVIPYNFKDEYFVNCSHLNEKGAKLFTELLFKEMNKD